MKKDLKSLLSALELQQLLGAEDIFPRQTHTQHNDLTAWINGPIVAPKKASVAVKVTGQSKKAANLEDLELSTTTTAAEMLIASKDSALKPQEAVSARDIPETPHQVNILPPIQAQNSLNDGGSAIQKDTLEQDQAIPKMSSGKGNGNMQAPAPVAGYSEHSSQLGAKSQSIRSLSLKLSAKPLVPQVNLDHVTTLEQLREELEKFDGCELKKTAINMVLSDGNPNAEILLLGEAPGENEDKEGRPFCGRSGKLLDKVLQSIGLSRKENIYITNVIFWRPPANRKPTPEEMEICRPFVEKHISLINPKLIIACGSTAAEFLLGTGEAVSRLCGCLKPYQGPGVNKDTTVSVIYHPSFLLRSPGSRKQTWFHLLGIQRWLRGKR